ncbi:PDR/VanB family oxidoreductase [Bradyrhizobium genosp. P]|uniref:PDR/VanB family oxidoreductase n=1 Tax=Bradyrhizobium genosp. P TaxID=83641 RepID=UPI003CEE9371
MNSSILNPQAVSEPDTLQLRVRQIRFEAPGVNSYELVDPDGRLLPEVGAGTHVDVHLPDRMVRQYSLSNDPAERHHYIVAVLKDETGRGGSKALHEAVHVPDVIRIGLPRNNFRLDETASEYILLAGGIGITPLKAMCHRLEAIGANFVLHYCTKSAEYTAFRDELMRLGQHRSVRLHHDGGNPANGLNIEALLAKPKEGTQIYYCGPPGFMKACARATQHWPSHSVHCEHFGSPIVQRSLDASGKGVDADEFDVEIASTGKRIHVAAEQSIVEALVEAGIQVETSCVSGLCGACKVRYLAGQPDHRDFILSDDEKDSYLTTCVSRCRMGPLVLDL